MTEMDNALQYQIYEQLKMLNNNVQGISQKQERTPSYNEFSQMLPLMQTQYAQSLMPSYSSDPAIPSGGGFAGSVHNFLNAQAQGLYSGLGITPERQQFVQANMLQPAGAFAATQYGHSKSLIGGLGAAMFTNPTLGMTATQKQMYATNLAANTALAGTSVAQGLSTIGGGAAMLYGMGSLAGGIGLGPLAAGAGVLWGASKVAASPLVNALTGGRVGGMDPRIFRPFQYVKDQIEEDKEIKNFLTQNAYKFIAPEGLDGRSGVDLSIQSRGDWADMIRNLDKDIFLKDEDVRTIVEGLIQGNIIENVDGLEDARKEIEKYADFAKEAKIILGGTYDDIVDLMAEFKRSGISPENFDVTAAELKGYAALIGRDIEEVAAYGLGVTQQRSRGTTHDAGRVYDSALTSAAYIKDFFNTYEDTEEYTDVVNYIRNFDSVMEVENQLHNTMLKVFHSGAGETYASAILKPLGDGEFGVDQAKLDHLVDLARSGKIKAPDLGDMAAENIETWDRNSRFVWQHNAGEIFENLDIGDQLKISELLTNTFATSMGVSETAVAQGFFGVTRPEAKLLEALIQHYDENGDAVDERLKEISEKIEEETKRESEKQDRLMKNFVKSTIVLENIFDHTAKPIILAIEKIIEKMTFGAIKARSPEEIDATKPDQVTEDDIDKAMGIDPGKSSADDTNIIPKKSSIDDMGDYSDYEIELYWPDSAGPRVEPRTATVEPSSDNAAPDFDSNEQTKTSMLPPPSKDAEYKKDVIPTGIVPEDDYAGRLTPVALAPDKSLAEQQQTSAPVKLGETQYSAFIEKYNAARSPVLQLQAELANANKILALTVATLTRDEPVRSDIRPMSTNEIAYVKHEKDPLSSSITDTNAVADKAARVTEQHTEVLKTYFSSLERSIANIEERLATSYGNNTIVALSPTIAAPGRFAHRGISTWA